MRPRGRNRNYRDPRRDQPMINERIRSSQVRVIDDKNAQLGVMETRAAIDLARDRGYDLILVAAQAQPPVCRIMDYGKFKYEKSKRDKLARSKSASNELKMVRLHPRTSEHDRSILVRHAEKFLRDGHKVRVVCQFKGRENAYPQIGREQLDAVAEELKEIAIVEGTVNKQGREMAMMLNPVPGLKPLPKVSRDGVVATDDGVEGDEIEDEEMDDDVDDVDEMEGAEDEMDDDDEMDEDEMDDESDGIEADVTEDDAIEVEANDDPPESNPS